MASLNPIVYIPPTLLLFAILGIVIYTYQDSIQDRYLEAIYRLRNYRRQDNEQDEELTEEQLRELYGGADAGDIPEELLRQFAEEDNNDDDADADEDEDEDEEEGEEVQEEVRPEGSTTSARLRMHHEMVQQMRARAGFAPEPFPGDVVPGEEGAAAGEEGEDVEDDGGVGSSQGATAHRIKKVGKKKAEKLQRKEQMRAYHEFMEMQRTERRQQEEMFRIHEAAAQEERQRKRTAQIEKDRQRKEQLKEKEAKENDSRRKRIQAERVKEETARRELRSYIQRVKSFKLGALAKRLDRTEAQLLKDLSAIAQESSSDSDILITLANSPSATPSLPSVSTATPSSSSSASKARQHLLILYDSASEQYVILDKAKLEAFAAVVQSKGRMDKKELSIASETILQSASSSVN